MTHEHIRLREVVSRNIVERGSEAKLAVKVRSSRGLLTVVEVVVKLLVAVGYGVDLVVVDGVASLSADCYDGVLRELLRCILLDKRGICDGVDLFHAYVGVHRGVSVEKLFYGGVLATALSCNVEHNVVFNGVNNGFRLVSD